MNTESQPYLSPEYQAQALAEFLAKHVKPYDPETDDYDRPPFAEDIKEGKNDPIYNAHSYHTKVPPRSIIPYILHYTRPGDVVLDPFCGSGMTGVAAQMCANPPADLLAQFPDLKDRVGPRACILNDLSPAACHIAYNYNTPVDTDAAPARVRANQSGCKGRVRLAVRHRALRTGGWSLLAKKPELLARLKNPPAGAATARLLNDSIDRTWKLLTRSEVESRLGYPVTDLPPQPRGVNSTWPKSPSGSQSQPRFNTRSGPMCIAVKVSSRLRNRPGRSARAERTRASQL
ncbi:MAG: DNA methyltransferase [Pirellulales bacterium]